MKLNIDTKFSKLTDEEIEAKDKRGELTMGEEAAYFLDKKGHIFTEERLEELIEESTLEIYSVPLRYSKIRDGIDDSMVNNLGSYILMRHQLKNK